MFSGSEKNKGIYLCCFRVKSMKNETCAHFESTRGESDFLCFSVCVCMWFEWTMPLNLVVYSCSDSSVKYMAVLWRQMKKQHKLNVQICNSCERICPVTSRERGCLFVFCPLISQRRGNVGGDEMKVDGSPKTLCVFASQQESPTMQDIAPNFLQGVMVMTFTVILSFLPLDSFVICSIGISTHWTWQNQARVRPQMCSETVNWLPFL